MIYDSFQNTNWHTIIERLTPMPAISGFASLMALQVIFDRVIPRLEPKHLFQYEPGKTSSSLSSILSCRRDSVWKNPRGWATARLGAKKRDNRKVTDSQNSEHINVNEDLLALLTFLLYHFWSPMRPYCGLMPQCRNCSCAWHFLQDTSTNAMHML